MQFPEILRKKKVPRNQQITSVAGAGNLLKIVAHPAGEDKTDGGFFILSHITSCRNFAVLFGLNQRNPACIKALLV